MGKRKKPALKEFTWDDLEEWAGSRIVSRGKSYKRSVSDLRQTAEGELVAWVQGSYRYATAVCMSDKAVLSSRCTCPYSYGPCKHAVAVILVYLDSVQQKNPVPPASSEDARLRELSDEEFSDSSDDWEDEDEEWEDDEFEERETRVRGRSREKVDGGVRDLKDYLSGMPKDALVDFVFDLAQRNSEVRKVLSDRKLLERGSVGKIAASIRREIDELSRQPAWTNHWTGEGEIPDYSRVLKRLESLLEKGRADLVVELGRLLLDRGLDQIEYSHDEGELICEIASCMEVIIRAVGKSSLSKVDQILWMIDAHLSDQYGLVDASDDYLLSGGYGRGDWDEVANRLGERLERLAVPTETTKRRSFAWRYDRGHLMGWVIRALELAGRKNEVIPLLEREAPITGCFEQLVDRLISARRRKEAVKWARQGFAETLGDMPGFAWNLEDRLRSLAERDKDWPLAAAYRALEFFERPDLSRYTSLEEASKRANVWPAVRKSVLHFLETGCLPDIGGWNPTPKTSGRVKTANSMTWPLPPTELDLPPKGKNAARFPDADTLLDIAIEEKRNEEALKWYESAKKGHYGARVHDDKVANAVQRTHPEAALKLWRGLAEAEIARVQPSAYQEAARYLKKMEAVYLRQKRRPEWEAYIAQLRAENRRRPRMIETLNRLEGRKRKIIET